MTNNNTITPEIAQSIIAQNKDKLINAQLEDLANKRAEREPIPGPVNAAFSLEDNIEVETSVGIVNIRTMKSMDISIFKLTNSPIYNLIMQDIPKDETKDPIQTLFVDEDMLFAIIYQFTNDIRKVYKLISKGGKDAYKEQVMDTVAAVYNPKDTILLLGKIMQHLGETNKARVQFEVPETDNKQPLNEFAAQAEDVKKN